MQIPKSAHLLQPPRTPPLYWWVMGALTACALVPTLWTQWDLVAAGYFIGPGARLQSVQWFWVEWINLYVPAVFRVFVVSALAGWLLGSFTRYGKTWRMHMAFIAIAGALGPGLLVNSGFKDNWQRARPYQVQEFGGTQSFSRAAVMTDQCDNNCSFVSGHVACGFFLATLMLVHRRRRLWAFTGVLSGLIIGFARMSAGAHWLSDVLWACPITMLCSWIVWKALLHAYRNQPDAMPRLDPQARQGAS